MLRIEWIHHVCFAKCHTLTVNQVGSSWFHACTLISRVWTIFCYHQLLCLLKLFGSAVMEDFYRKKSTSQEFLSVIRYWGVLWWDVQTCGGKIRSGRKSRERRTVICRCTSWRGRFGTSRYATPTLPKFNSKKTLQDDGKGGRSGFLLGPLGVTFQGFLLAVKLREMNRTWKPSYFKFQQLNFGGVTKLLI